MCLFVAAFLLCLWFAQFWGVGLTDPLRLRHKQLYEVHVSICRRDGVLFLRLGSSESVC